MITEWGSSWLLQLSLMASQLPGGKVPSSYHGAPYSSLKILQLLPSWVWPTDGQVLFKGRLWSQGEQG